jgi:hypothetical protein
MSSAGINIDIRKKELELDRLFKSYSNEQENPHPFYMPISICEEIVSKICLKESDLILVLYNLELVWTLKNKYNVNIERIIVWTNDFSIFHQNKCEKIGCIYLWGELDMQFDVVIGNPPFNSATENSGVSGTIGNKTLYRAFIKKAFEFTITNGIVAMVSQKGAYKFFGKLGKQIDSVNMMTEKDYWKYDTLYFIARNIPKQSEYIIEDKIVSKIFAHNEIGLQYFSNSLMQNVRAGLVEESGDVIVKLPGIEPIKYGKITKEDLVAHGPKFAFTMLESVKSYIATEDPLYASCSCYLPTKTLEQAQKIKLFVENNKAFRYLTKTTKCKAHAEGLSRVKKFDIDQIVTGYEYPREWNLTEEDIKAIENVG